MKNSCEENQVSAQDKEEVVPDLGEFFRAESDKKNRKGGFLKNFTAANIRPLIFSTFILFFQHLPVWIMPIATANLIDAVSAAINGGMTDELTLTVILNISAFFLSIILNVPFTVLRWKIVSKMLRRTSAGIKSAVVRKLQSLSITYHKDMQSGKIQAKFLKDVDSVDGLFSALMFSLIPNIISVVISSAISVYKNIYVSLFFLIIIPTNVLLTMTFRKKIMKTNRDFRIKNEDMSEKMTTMMEMTPITKSHGLQAVEIAKLNRYIAGVAKSGRSVDKVNAYFGSWSFVIQHVLNLLCLGFCCFLAVNKIISVGEIVLYQTMFNTISAGISGLIAFAPQMSRGLDALSSLSEIMTATEVEHFFGKIKINDIKGDVEFRNVSYRYPAGEKDVVKDFSLKVKAGQCVAFVGASGSGKSTIMNLLIGLLSPTGGEIYIDGEPMSELDLLQYRHNISVVPQNSILFSGSVKENITYGLDKYTDEQLDCVLEMANVKEFLPELSNGVNTIVGEHGDKLSGGQKQRITIARALIRNPKILILDEATSALDNVSEYHVQKAINASIGGRTTFIVAHRLSTIRNADIIVVMDDGKCVEKGSFEQLMKLKGKFFKLKSLSELTAKAVENVAENT